MSMQAQHIGVRAPLPGVVYPPPEQLQRYVASGALGFETLPQAFATSFKQQASRIAISGPEGDVTYAELDSITSNIAASFTALGLQPLDRVLFQMTNCAEVLYCFLACLKAGLIPVCTLAPHREREIGYLARHSGAVMHIVRGDDAKFDDIAFAQKMQLEVPTLKHIVQARGEVRTCVLKLSKMIAACARVDWATDQNDSQKEAKNSFLAPQMSDPFQVAVFQLSGGTSGVPKIIPRFHNDYVCHMRAVAQACGFTQHDRIFNPLPMMHNLNMGCFYGPALLVGATVCIAPDMSNPSLVSIFQNQQPTWVMLTDPIMTRLQAEIESRQITFAQLRGIVGPNSAPKMRAATGAAAFHIFGMTEGVITYTQPGDPPAALDQTVGRPVHALDEIRILKAGSQELAIEGEMGDAQFRGPYTIHGYYNAAERQRESFTADGWYASGDLMSYRILDGTTYYSFQGRTKDVVDRGGEKISAEEVEWACNAHPAVGAAGVVPMPDEVLGERVCVFVVLKDGYTELTAAALGEFLQSWGMAKYKWPERVECIARMPLTQSGKMSKPELRAMLAARAAT